MSRPLFLSPVQGRHPAAPETPLRFYPVNAVKRIVRQRRSYDAETKAAAVEAVHNGETPTEVANRMGIVVGNIHNWVNAHRARRTSEKPKLVAAPEVPKSIPVKVKTQPLSPITPSAPSPFESLETIIRASEKIRMALVSAHGRDAVEVVLAASGEIAMALVPLPEADRQRALSIARLTMGERTTDRGE